MKMTLYYVVQVVYDKTYTRGDEAYYVAGPFGSRTKAFDELSSSSLVSDHLEVVEQTVEVK